jgi:hypothetical protein
MLVQPRRRQSGTDHEEVDECAALCSAKDRAQDKARLERAVCTALKSAGVPVIWVGLPSQRGTNASADSAYLNELYRSEAEKAGIVYVDIWDGFVDEDGKFSPQGPD